MNTTLDRHILIADDDDRIRELLKAYLERAGYRVTAVANSDQVEKLVNSLQFEMIILDVMMPQKDGFTLTRDLREAIDTPIILLTAKSETDDRIAGLEAGCDDFISKPFEPKELLLRMAAIFRRVDLHSGDSNSARFLRFGKFRFDPAGRELWSGDDYVHLTGVECDILAALAQTPNETVSRESLAERVGRPLQNDSDRIIDVQITRVRRKIEDAPKQPRYLQTVRGIGYILMTE